MCLHIFILVKILLDLSKGNPLVISWPLEKSSSTFYVPFGIPFIFTCPWYISLVSFHFISSFPRRLGESSVTPQKPKVNQIGPR